MNECACNSMSQHNGKDSLLLVLRSDFLSGEEEECGTGDPGSGFIVDGGRITSSCDYF